MGARMVVAVASVGLALAGCRAHTVTLVFSPHEGDVYRYVYEIEATITRTVAGAAPQQTVVSTKVESTQTVLEVTSDGARVEVTLATQGAAPRSAVVLLDRAGSLAAIQDVPGLRLDESAIPGVEALASGVTETPARALALDDRWDIDEGRIQGEGRLDHLGVVDDRHVAVVAISLIEVLTGTVPVRGSDAVLDGELRSATSVTFDLADGAVRRGRTRSKGTVDVLVAPPPGVVAPPAEATISFELAVSTTRVG